MAKYVYNVLISSYNILVEHYYANNKIKNMLHYWFAGIFRHSL